MFSNYFCQIIESLLQSGLRVTLNTFVSKSDLLICQSGKLEARRRDDQSGERGQSQRIDISGLDNLVFIQSTFQYGKVYEFESVY